MTANHNRKWWVLSGATLLYLATTADGPNNNATLLGRRPAPLHNGVLPTLLDPGVGSGVAGHRLWTGKTAASRTAFSMGIVKQWCCWL